MYAPRYPITIPPMLSLFTRGIGLISEDLAATPAASTAFETASRAIYMPIIVPASCVVRRVWWVNGATVAGGATIEVGVYADADYGPGVKLVSGSATQGTANEVQFVDVTDTPLPPGLVWIAISASSATNTTLFRSAVSGQLDAGYRFQEASASPLPASATPVVTVSGNIYLCGFATTASP